MLFFPSRSQIRPRTRFRQLQSWLTRQNHQRRTELRQQILTQFPQLCLKAKNSDFLTLFAPKARLTKIATGFQFTEGPIWLGQQQYLLFSDIPANHILQLSRPLSPTPSVQVFRSPSQNANGLTLDFQGRLIVCEQGTRQLTRTEVDGSITVLASHFQGKRLNSPNDVVVKSDGAIYFTDPPYGINPHQQEQPHQGVYRLNPQTQELTLVIADFEKPNGLVFSPDEQQLYISDSSIARQHVRVFNVKGNGSLSGGTVFCDLKVDRPGVPDGMICDHHGNLFCTGAGGIWVFSPTGNRLGTIRVPEVPSNCTWGDTIKNPLTGNDETSLYITARQSIYHIRCLGKPAQKVMTISVGPTPTNYAQSSQPRSSH